jgi:hypothetical protein
LVVIALAAGASAQAPVVSVAQLLDLDSARILQLYRTGVATGLPPGKIRGTPLLATGTRRARLLSRGARLLWQGKVIDDDASGAVNRFAGLRVIRGELYQAPSWLDGNPSLVLDYGRTSHVYARYRDEIRRIAPGLYLGLMFDRSQCPPELAMTFALETCRSSRISRPLRACRTD